MRLPARTGRAPPARAARRPAPPRARPTATTRESGTSASAQACRARVRTVLSNRADRERRGLDADLVHPRAIGPERPPRLAVAAGLGERGDEREVRLLVVGVALEHAQQEAHRAVVVARG